MGCLSLSTRVPRWTPRIDVRVCSSMAFLPCPSLRQGLSVSSEVTVLAGLADQGAPRTHLCSTPTQLDIWSCRTQSIWVSQNWCVWLVCWFIWDRVSLCSPDWPGTHYVKQASLERSHLHPKCWELMCTPANFDFMLINDKNMNLYKYSYKMAEVYLKSFQ